MVCGAHELYDEVLERGIYGDWKKKTEKFEEVWKFFRGG